MNALFLCLFLINLLLVLFMIFCEQKRPFRVLIWLVLFLLLPIIGFVLYAFFGVGVIKRSKKLNQILNKSKLYKKSLKSNCQNVENRLSKNSLPMIFNANLHNSFVLFCEKIEIFRNGELAFESIIEAIKRAKHSIFVQTYIFAEDQIGTKIKDLLVEKAKSGIKVVVIYDSLGSRKLKKNFFEELENCGGIVTRFFPPIHDIEFLNLFLNYRNHRKIIVIDEMVSFVGGLNIRDDHLGKNEKLSPWLDTHLKIVGNSSFEFLRVVLQDLKLSVKQKDKTKLQKL
ncbi:MAG: phospholipase D-like domain-containing protein, partial [Christensenellales bacterium]